MPTLFRNWGRFTPALSDGLNAHWQWEHSSHFFQELRSLTLRPLCNANRPCQHRQLEENASRCIPDLNKTTTEMHFFILSSILFLNTVENTEISHAQRHNSRRRKAAQSFLFWPSSYTFHVALIIKRGKVWGRAIQLNHTPLPCCEERNSKLFYFAYWVVKFCIISKVYLTSPLH